MKMREEDFVPYEAGLSAARGRALVFAPHPDDEVFGCCGAIIRHVEQGDEIKVVIVTDGGCKAGLGRDDPGYRDTRRMESEKAAGVLGYGRPEFLDLPDRGLQDDPGLVRQLLAIIDDFNPENIYLPAETEINPDHRALNSAGIRAVALYEPEVNILFYEIGQPLAPNLLHDITDIHPLVEKAMECFPSQLEVQDYRRHINALHSYRTFTLSREVEFAEAYLKVKSSVFKDGDLRWRNRQPLEPSRSPSESVSGEYPLISVIVRTMNSAYLAEALESIAGQTYPNLEVIVVDARGGGSLLLGEWCGRFPLRLVTNSFGLNRPEACNAGLKEVRENISAFSMKTTCFFLKG